MKLRILDKFMVISDNNQFTLNVIKTRGEDSKTPGAEHLKPIAYYPDFDSLLKGILRHSLLRSEAESVEEVLQVLKEVNNSIREFINGQGRI